MKVCPHCSTQNDDASRFCEKCGESLGGAASPAANDSLRGDELLNKAGDLLSAGAQRARKAAEGFQKAASEGAAKASQGTAKRKKLEFVDQGETAVATIGNSYLENYLLGGSTSKGVGILTQKRFYYMGKCFFGSGKNLGSNTKEGVVNIEDISYTEFSHVRHIGLLIPAILLTLAAIPLPNAVFFAALPFYIMYFIMRSSCFVIAFSGGSFVFNIHLYPIEDIQDFQRQLYLLKDKIREEQRA